MTRMIERWFPCKEVSEASSSGWGSGNSEKNLFSWFAGRPIAQAKAAVLTSLLPWPDDAEAQRSLQELVRRAMMSRDGAWDEVVAELGRAYPDGASLADPFSGRALIPLEAARLGVKAYGIDYSLVATLAGSLLADYPLRDWSSEPDLPFGDASLDVKRLVQDVQRVLAEIGKRYEESVAEYYPKNNGKQPWGYLWAVTLPCEECHRRFPLTGSLLLRYPLPRKGDPGQSYRIEVDREHGTFRVIVHDGLPRGNPTLVATTRSGKKLIGKSAICPFCDHLHPKAVHARLAAERHGRDELLVAADLDPDVGKLFREPTADERSAIKKAEKALAEEPGFADGISAIPDEIIPEGNSDTIRASVYGARTFGDLCNARQTLSLIRLARIIAELGLELQSKAGLSADYAAALTGYAGSVLVRKLKHSTRGARLYPNNRPTSNRVYIDHIFRNEATLAFNYDYFECGIGGGPGTWTSVSEDTINALKNQLGRKNGRHADIFQGSAVTLPFRDAVLSAVVTDPPYDEMIPYSDASDLFYVWLKRALVTTHPWITFTADPHGVQDKSEEIIVKRFRAKRTAKKLDHRTQDFYDSMIVRAFGEARRVVTPDGVVTIVFGHGDPDVWHRLLQAIMGAELVLTGSWPAKTESGGSAGSANIVTTLTMACRRAPALRSAGRANLVEAEVKREVKAREPMWEAAGLALPDQRMASAGPAMEVVGRYSEVLDNLGDPVAPDRYLLVARRAVDEAAAIEIDHLPLETFDIRTRFALAWVRDYRRSPAAKSEARWQALAADLEVAMLRGVLTEVSNGVRLSTAAEFKGHINEASSVIDVALALAKAWPDGLDAVGEILVASQRNTDDPFLWAAMKYLSSRLPEADPDAIAWTELVRGRRAIGTATREFASVKKRAEEEAQAQSRQGTLFDFTETDTEGQ